MVAAILHSDGLQLGLLTTAFAFGFRHGIDWDHIAAITDITSSQNNRRGSMLLATLYAAGHGLVVFALGSAAIVFGARLPGSIDSVMERFVGATLLILGIYVLVTLFRSGREFRMRSRWMLIFSAVKLLTTWFRSRRAGDSDEIVIDHEHEHGFNESHGQITSAQRPVNATPSRASFAKTVSAHTLTSAHVHRHHHVGSLPDDPFMNYSNLTAFAVGMIHGVGAETPSQLLIFLAAATVQGKVMGLVILVCFLGGLLLANSSIAIAASYGFITANRNFTLYLVVSCVTAAFSLVIGLLFLFGQSTVLPALFGG